MMEKLLAKGVKHLFVSNSDNLDLDALTYFAKSGMAAAVK
jgi:UDP-N-acetylglucosamine pyrophosphorylase